MPNIFDLEPRTIIMKDDSYILSYPYLLSYFSSKSDFSIEDFVRGAHMVYGWMPTVLDLYPEAPNISLEAGANILTKAKNAGSLADDEIENLVRLTNNSLVGASKLLHFVAPQHFPIWDSKIYAFVFQEKSHNYRVSQISNYRKYLKLLSVLQNDDLFESFHQSVNEKIGYHVSKIRAIELIMFLNSPALSGPA